jgi:hypothetical protein
VRLAQPFLKRNLAAGLARCAAEENATVE